MAYLTAVLSDSPLHVWPNDEGGGRITTDVRGIPPTPLVLQLTEYQSGLGYTGPDSQVGAWMETVNPNWGINSVPFIPIAAPFTYEVWMWMHSTTSSFQILMWQYDTGTSKGIQLVWTAANRFQFIINATGLTGTAPLSMYQWNHFAATYDGATMRTYVNGAPDANTPLVGPTFVSTSFVVGNNLAGAQLCRGFLSTPAVYASALSAARIAAHHAAADRVGTSPEYVLAGSGPTPAPFSNGDLGLVLQSVRKTYVAP